MRRLLVTGAILGLLFASGAGARANVTVAITSAPPSPSSSTDATFEFSSDARDATFECALDGGRAAPCHSPITYRGLAFGDHTFVVSAASGRDRASARYAWTIVAGPPPPPRSEGAPLVVTVVGAGAVTSVPAGIACPGDCAEAFPLGTSVELTALATAPFGGWTGACTGTGACALKIAGATGVKARFGLPGGPASTPDGDGDGVAAAQDACPSSRGVAAMRGCTVGDLVRDGDRLLEPLADQLADARLRLRAIPRLRLLAPRLVRNLDLVEAGAAALERGDVCGGAAKARRGVQGLGAVQKESAKLIAGLQANVLKEPSPRVGDAHQKELEWAGLSYIADAVEDVAKEAAYVGKAFRAACGSLGAKVVLRGRVKKTDDAKGLLELENGARVQLPDRDYGNRIAEGALVRVDARLVRGGPSIGKSVGLLGAVKFAHLLYKPCVKILVAHAAQDFDDPTPTLHHPDGYRAGTALWLEYGARVAATPKCSNALPGRYSLAIEATSPGSQKITVTTDLAPGEAPVPLEIPPSGLGSTKVWTLKVTERRQGSNCPPPNPGNSVRVPAAANVSFPCPVVVLGTTEHKVRMRGQATYGRAIFEKTAFPIESYGWALNKVTAVTGLHFTIPSATFMGRGYKLLGYNGLTPEFTGLLSVGHGETFAVMPESWYGFPWLFPLASIGVDHYAGLMWPRIVGTRNGKPFSYRAELPDIIADLLPDCPGTNCLHRLPWALGEVEDTTQGNGPGGFSHSGTQQFAFDFVLENGETIVATRGGVIGDVQQSLSQNFNPCDDPAADGPSNYVRIDHGDGTWSYYAHIQQWSMFQKGLSEGAKVSRGTPIASVGNVGRSCGPHLHFQVAIDNTATIYGQTTQICFEGYRWDWDDWEIVFEPCYIPVEDDLLGSNNG